MEKFQIPKLKGKSNWTVWKLQVESSLQYRDLKGELSSQIVAPDPLPVDASEQRKKDHCSCSEAV